LVDEPPPSLLGPEGSDDLTHKPYLQRIHTEENEKRLAINGKDSVAAFEQTAASLLAVTTAL
jgi:hypothetical protein